MFGAVIGFTKCLYLGTDPPERQSNDWLLATDLVPEYDSLIIASVVILSTLADPMHYRANKIQATSSAIIFINNLIKHAMSKAARPVSIHQKTTRPTIGSDYKRPDGRTPVPWRDRSCAIWDVPVIDRKTWSIPFGAYHLLVQ